MAAWGGRWLKIALVLGVIAAILALGGYSTIKTLILSQLVGISVTREGEVEEAVSGKAIITRYESVLRSPVTGTVRLTLEEGILVRAEAVVAELSDTLEREQAETRVTQLESDLAAYNAANTAEEEALTAAVTEAVARSAEEAETLRAACLAGDVEAMRNLSASLADLSGQEIEDRDRLQAIRDDRAAIEDALNTSREALARSVFPVTTPEAGIVSYCLDGLEETLTPESVGQMGSKDLLSADRRQTVVEDQSRIQAGDPVAKIIGDAGVYVSVVVTGSQADDLAAVGQVSLRFPGFEGRREVGATLYHVGERESNGYCVATYETAELLDGMIAAREVDVDVVTHTYTGIVIPRKALVHRGGLDGVFVLDLTECRFKPITVLGGDEDEVVIEGLKAGVQVVSTPWLVDEGTRIGAKEVSEDLV